MTVILLRHGESTSNIAHTLAGRTPGVGLTERGERQAASVAERLATVELAALVRSPLLRCEQTVAPLASTTGLTPVVDERLSEVDYGDWTGRALRELVTEPLWDVVQRHASGATFPGGESLSGMQRRAVDAVRDHDRRLAAEHGHDVVWLACSHGDVIKAIIADAFAIHLDGFQRIVAEPASISVVRYTRHGPSVWRVNDTGADLSGLRPLRHSSDTAVPGGEVAPAME